MRRRELRSPGGPAGPRPARPMAALACPRPWRCGRCGAANSAALVGLVAFLLVVSVSVLKSLHGTMAFNSRNIALHVTSDAEHKLRVMTWAWADCDAAFRGIDVTRTARSLGADFGMRNVCGTATWSDVAWLLVPVGESFSTVRTAKLRLSSDARVSAIVVIDDPNFGDDLGFIPVGALLLYVAYWSCALSCVLRCVAWGRGRGGDPRADAAGDLDEETKAAPHPALAAGPPCL